MISWDLGWILFLKTAAVGVSEIHSSGPFLLIQRQDNETARTQMSTQSIRFIRKLSNTVEGLPSVLNSSASQRAVFVFTTCILCPHAQDAMLGRE